MAGRGGRRRAPPTLPRALLGRGPGSARRGKDGVGRRRSSSSEELGVVGRFLDRTGAGREAEAPGVEPLRRRWVRGEARRGEAGLGGGREETGRRPPGSCPEGRGRRCRDLLGLG